MESFLEMETMAKKFANKNINIKTAVHVLDGFPLTNLEDLKKIERKLKNDESFYSIMVRYFISFIKLCTLTYCKQIVKRGLQ